MIYMIFLSNILMISPHIVFNIPFYLMYDISYPLHVKTTLLLFLLWLMFDLPRFFDFFTKFARNLDLILKTVLKNSFS